MLRHATVSALQAWCGAIAAEASKRGMGFESKRLARMCRVLVAQSELVWPNGQGASLLRRRLRVRVPPRVCWKKLSGANHEVRPRTAQRLCIV